ncbi:MAG: tRNA pseudouridine(13) synthase TruD [Woeseia sp.]
MTELPDWWRAYGEPVVSGELRNQHTDFQVEEQLGFALSGDGEHDYLQIEKVGANTTWVARGLAEFAGIAASGVGYAGMKDRHAVTTQWFSVSRPRRNPADWSKLDIAGVRIIQTERHGRKLRRGTHAGNRFRVALRNATVMDKRIEERLATVRDSGVPNYFGEQRFGHDGANLELARDLFSGKRLSRARRSIALSAARSFLFNRILEERVSAANWNLLLPGDCASLDGSASIFNVEQVDDELRRRIDSLDIHPSGAMWGAGQLQSGGETADLEQSVVTSYPDLARGVEEAGLKMGRRSLRLAVRTLSWDRRGDSLVLNFYLARGGFATAVLREIAAY